MSACGWLLWNQRNVEEQEWLWGIFMMQFILLMCPGFISCKWICPNVSRIFKKGCSRLVLVCCSVWYQAVQSPASFHQGSWRSRLCHTWTMRSIISPSLVFFHLSSSFSFCFFPSPASWSSHQAAFRSRLTPPPQPGGFLSGMWSTGCPYLCTNLYTLTSFMFIWCKFLSFWGFPIDLVRNLAPQMAGTHH